MKIREEQDVGRRARRGGAAGGDRGRPARPPRARAVHRPRPRGRAARDPADRPPPAQRRAAAQLAGAIGREAALDWLREDPLANDHHRHWHIVYPAQRPARARGVRSRTARASCSSTCTSRCWPATTPSGARSASARSCRSPTTASRSARATRTGRAAQALRDIDRQDHELTLIVEELEAQRDRLLAAVAAGAVQNGGGPIPLTSELLGRARGADRRARRGATSGTTATATSSPPS